MQLAQTAQAAINLPNDKIRYALFWFCNADPIDSTGLSNLASGDSEKAKTPVSDAKKKTIQRHIIPQEIYESRGTSKKRPDNSKRKDRKRK